MQESLSNGKEYSCFFSKEAVLRFTCGILIVVVIAIAFFFITGGEIESISDNYDFDKPIKGFIILEIQGNKSITIKNLSTTFFKVFIISIC